MEGEIEKLNVFLNLLFSFAGIVFLDCAWSYYLSLFISNWESDFLYSKSCPIYLFGDCICLEHWIVSSAWGRIGTPCNLSHKGSFFGASRDTDSLWYSSSEHSVSTIFNQWSFSSQLPGIPTLSCSSISLWVALCTWLVLHSHISDNVWLAQGSVLSSHYFSPVYVNCC